ncbi:unnamed protein product [Auanema sp. JU1783]|nr:unnamed protein product [Auanema sp. JU1783]
MLSELVISGTLFINACAVLNLKLSKSPHDFDQFISETESRSLGDRAREFIVSLQYFRVFIAIWNFFIIFLMFV